MIPLHATIVGKECDPNTGTTDDNRRANDESASCDPDCSAVRCGDGYLNVMAGEICDDEYVESGPPPATATCDPDCTMPACGDGVGNSNFEIDLIAPDAPPSDCPGATCFTEQCDPGTGLSADPQRAAMNSEWCDLDCSTARCGDGYVNTHAGEDCDPTFYPFVQPVPDTVDCDSNCTLRACGDGHVNDEAGEDCDPGDTDNPLTTSDPDLASADSPTCDRDCSNAACGDGYANEEASEECDDGNGNDNLGCLDNCTWL